jgi:hypothetical protein
LTIAASDTPDQVETPAKVLERAIVTSCPGTKG